MGGRTIENGEVVVRDGEIVAVGERTAHRHAGEIRDLGDCVLLPGFVNAHSHIDYTMSRNRCDALNLWDWIDRVGFNKHRPPDLGIVADSARLGAAECALSGVTCLGDSSFTGVAAEAMDAVGLRGIVYLELFGQSAGDRYEQVFAEKLNTIDRIRERCSGLVALGLSPHAVYTSNLEVLRLCADSCAELNTPIAIHLAETAAEADYLMHGTGPIAEWRRRMGYEPMVSGMTPTVHVNKAGLLRQGVCLAHCVHLSDDDLGLIASSGASVAHCPRSNAYLGAGIAPVPKLLAAGVGVGLGTDSAGSCLRLDFFEEMRFSLAVHRAVAEDAAAITANTLLGLATIGGARALGLADLVGTLEPGKRADMIAVDTTGVLPGEDLALAVLSGSPADVVMTIVDGVELVRDRRLTRFDRAECLARLKDSMTRMGIE